MRITCSTTLGGNVYRLYRANDRFHVELKRLIPFLLKTAADVEVGPTEADQAVMLSVGPFRDEDERAFRERARPFLNQQGCPGR